MAQAYLRAGSTYYYPKYENVEEEPIVNANTSITIGGIVNSQADSERLRIRTIFRVPQSEISDLQDVYTDFKESLYYKPSRLLYGKSAIEEIRVVLRATPRIENRTHGEGSAQFWIRFEFEEIIET